MAYLVPRTEFIIQSPLIDFKATGTTTVYTTPSGRRLVITESSQVCVSATAANADSIFNIGWTAPDYDNYTGIAPLTFLPTTANEYYVSAFNDVAIVLSMPPTTALIVNVTSADTGTALTGYVFIKGYLI